MGEGEPKKDNTVPKLALDILTELIEKHGYHKGNTIDADSGDVAQIIKKYVDAANKEFPTLEQAHKRYHSLDCNYLKLYSTSRAYYDLTQEWKKKYFGDST